MDMIVIMCITNISERNLDKKKLDAIPVYI
jgi:hypothetical protein